MRETLRPVHQLLFGLFILSLDVALCLDANFVKPEHNQIIELNTEFDITFVISFTDEEVRDGNAMHILQMPCDPNDLHRASVTGVEFCYEMVLESQHRADHKTVKHECKKATDTMFFASGRMNATKQGTVIFQERLPIHQRCPTRQALTLCL